LRSRDRNSIYILYGNEIPDQLVLKDSHVQLFITAGELGRIQQALYASVPILGVPFTAEQLENINAIVHAGAGIVHIPEIFQSGDITETCEKLLTCSRYCCMLKVCGFTFLYNLKSLFFSAVIE
jgi:hypothetical protein